MCVAEKATVLELPNRDSGLNLVARNVVFMRGNRNRQNRRGHQKAATIHSSGRRGVTRVQHRVRILGG